MRGPMQAKYAAKAADRIAAEKEERMKKFMKITLKDGSCKEYGEAKKVIEIAADISEGLARMAAAAEIDGKTADLRTVIDKDCELNILTANDEEGLRTVRHTASHVLAEAVKRVFPDAKLAIGPSIDTGFYYDFEHAAFFQRRSGQIRGGNEKDHQGRGCAGKIYPAKGRGCQVYGREK